jgi:hypothetical protein
MYETDLPSPAKVFLLYETLVDEISSQANFVEVLSNFQS